MPRGGDRGGGRPKGTEETKLLSHIRREPLHKVRIRQWIIEWLLSHPRQAGRMIENALLASHQKEMEEWKQKHYKEKKTT